MNEELVLAQTTEVLTAPTITREQVEILRKTVAPGTTNEELQLFLHVCRRTGLDPFARQIYAVKRSGKMTIQTAIDGFRLIAERTGKYRGQIGPQWADKDLKWVEVWTQDKPPYAARIGILRSDFAEPLWAVARWADYYPGAGQDHMWKKMGPHMIGKCVESLGLRRAFPQELSGLYGEEEMHAPTIESNGDDRVAQRVTGFKAVLQAATSVEELDAKWSASETFRENIGRDNPEAAGNLSDAYRRQRAAILGSAACEETAKEPSGSPATAPTAGKATKTLAERAEALTAALKVCKTAEAVEATWDSAKKLRAELLSYPDGSLLEGLALTKEARLSELREVK